MEGRGYVARGEESAFNFQESVGGFWVSVNYFFVHFCLNFIAMALQCAIGAGFNFSNLFVVAVWRRWRMRSWHLCLIVSESIESVVCKRDWARGRGPRLVLQRRSF
jgi:hypothetical protein